MTYPTYPVPGGYPGMPPQPMYPPLPPKPSGATAITAAVLAILGGAAALIGAVGGFLGAAGLAALESASESAAEAGVDAVGADLGGLPDWFASYLVGAGIADVVIAVLLVVGAIMLITKKSLGRMLVAAGCVLVILLGVVGSVLMSGIGSDAPAAVLMGNGIVTVVSLIFPVTTLILALVPSTARWCGAGAQPTAPGHYPPSSPYPTAS